MSEMYEPITGQLKITPLSLSEGSLTQCELCRYGRAVYIPDDHCPKCDADFAVVCTDCQDYHATRHLEDEGIEED